MRMNSQIDITDILPSVNVPALIINSRDDVTVDVEPARAIRCVCAIQEAVAKIGLTIRAGFHTGECEMMADKISEIAVHIGARVMGKAGPGEILVSGTVKDLVAGSGLRFQGRGVHELKGVPGKWRMFAVTG